MPSFAATWIAWAIHEPVIIRCSVVAAESSTEMIGSDMHAAPSGGQAHHCDGLAPYAIAIRAHFAVCSSSIALKAAGLVPLGTYPRIRDALLHLRFVEDGLYVPLSAADGPAAEQVLLTVGPAGVLSSRAITAGELETLLRLLGPPSERQRSDLKRATDVVLVEDGAVIYWPRTGEQFADAAYAMARVQASLAS